MLIGLPLLSPHFQSTAEGVRRLLPLRLAGVRRRPCGAAAVAGRRSCRPAGSPTMRFSPATAPPRRCPGRCSPSRPISARSWDRSRTAGLGRRCVWSRCSCRHSSSSSARCRSGTNSTPVGRAIGAARRQRGGRRPAARGALQAGVDRGHHRRNDFALAVAAFLLLFMWQVPPWLVVVLSAVGASLIAAF